LLFSWPLCVWERHVTGFGCVSWCFIDGVLYCILVFSVLLSRLYSRGCVAKNGMAVTYVDARSLRQGGRRWDVGGDLI
jgi:hypothetical protein